MLHRTWVAPLVVGFWFVTTGWFLVSKILPTFAGGVAPDAAALDVTEGPTLVGWTVNWNDGPIGWAFMESRRSDDGIVTIDSRLQCDRLPLEEILPGWAGPLARRAVRQAESTALHATGRLVFDPAGRLRSFVSRVALPGTAEPAVLEGTVGDDGEVAITFRAGELRYETTRRLPERTRIGDELSPQATLPGLYEGRRWTVPMYSPLRPGHAPLQILHAEVGGEETIFWDNRLVNARVVTYREDPSSPREPRSRLWVDRSGRVLRHESALLGAKMAFVRRTDAEAARLAAVAALHDAAPAPAGDPPPEPGP